MQIGKMCVYHHRLNLISPHCEQHFNPDSFSLYLLSDDLNVPAVITGVVVVCILVILCTFGVCYAHRQGYFSRMFKSVLVALIMYYAFSLCVFFRFIWQVLLKMSGVNYGTIKGGIYFAKAYLFSKKFKNHVLFC